MNALTLPLRALLDPVGAVPRAVQARSWVLPLVLLSVATAASGTAVALRLDAARLVIPQMEMTGELGKASEREIDEKIEQTQRVGIVAGIAKGVFVAPLTLLLIAVALKLTAWLLGRKTPFGALFTTSALAMLPVAVFHLALAAAALRQPALTPKLAVTLLPTSLAALLPDQPPKLDRVFQAIEFFNLWAAALLGLGFASAAQLKPWKGVLLGLFLYAMFAAVAYVGGPGLAMGGPGGPGGPGGHP